MKDFQVLGKLGDGAYSSVWKVKRISDGQEYAMKKVKLATLSEKEKLNALNEVRILASIKNPCIVGYKEAFFEDSPLTLCIVMEYAGGGDILNKITQHQKSNTFMKEQDIWRYAIQMIMGLKTLHDMKILHRDLKCANVFLSTDGKTAKLGDLNVSKVAKSELVYTQTGTPYYASPEVWRDEPYDMKSDIWSLGCVIYEMCALKPPFRANDMKGLFKKVQRGVFDRIPSSYTIDLYNLISMCLQVKPSARPSCDQLLAHPVVMRSGGGAFQQAMDFDDYNELLGTIRLPKNIKAIAPQLPKANYSQNSRSIEMEKGKGGQMAGYKPEIKRPTSQNAPQSKKGLYVRESQSRESRISQMQRIDPINVKESDRDYLVRMQKEYVEKSKALKLPDQARNQRSPKPNDGAILQKSPNSRVMSGHRPVDSAKDRHDSGYGVPRGELAKNEDHGSNFRRKAMEQKRIDEEKIRGEAAPERNMINKQEYLINKYQSRDPRQEEKNGLPRNYSGKDEAIMRKADYILEKYNSGDNLRKNSGPSLHQGPRKEPIDVLEKYKHMLNIKELPAKQAPYDNIKPSSNKNVDYQYVNQINSYSPRREQAGRNENNSVNPLRQQPQQKIGNKPVWWG